MGKQETGVDQIVSGMLAPLGDIADTELDVRHVPVGSLALSRTGFHPLEFDPNSAAPSANKALRSLWLTSPAPLPKSRHAMPSRIPARSSSLRVVGHNTFRKDGQPPDAFVASPIT